MWTGGNFKTEQTYCNATVIYLEEEEINIPQVPKLDCFIKCHYVHFIHLEYIICIVHLNRNVYDLLLSVTFITDKFGMRILLIFQRYTVKQIGIIDVRL